MEEINNAIDILGKSGTSDIALLHCNTQYPTPYEDVNLEAYGDGNTSDKIVSIITDYLMNTKLQVQKKFYDLTFTCD